MAAITFIYDDKEVIAHHEANWKWGNHDRSTLAELLPEKVKTIDALVKQAFEKIIKAKHAKQLVEHKAFKKMVADANKSGLTTEFEYNNKDPINTSIKSVTLSKAVQEGQRLIKASIHWDGKVYSSSGWGGSHTTDRPWCLRWDYKTLRYKKFNTAFEKAVERIEQKIKADKALSKAKEEQQQRDTRIAAELKPLGLSLTRDTSRKRSLASEYKLGSILKSEQHETYSWNDQISIFGEVWLKTNVPIQEHKVKNFKIKGKMTVNNYAKLVEFLATMVKSNEIEVD